jgi:hypothetical protein
VRDKGIRVTMIHLGTVNNNESRSKASAHEIQTEDIAELVYLAVTMPPRATLTEATVWAQDDDTQSLP